MQTRLERIYVFGLKDRLFGPHLTPRVDWVRGMNPQQHWRWSVTAVFPRGSVGTISSPALQRCLYTPSLPKTTRNQPRNCRFLPAVEITEGGSIA